MPESVLARDQCDDGVFCHAAWSGEPAAVNRLLDLDLDPDACGPDSLTPLRADASASDPVILRVLIDAGADVRAHGAGGGTALHGVARCSDPEVAHVLCRAGADIEATDDEGRTAFLRCAEEGNTAMLRALLELGAILHVLDSDGNSGLHLAAHQGELEAIDLLLERGVQRSLRNAEGRTALETALEHRKHEAVEGLYLPDESPEPPSAEDEALLYGFLVDELVRNVGAERQSSLRVVAEDAQLLRVLSDLEPKRSALELDPPLHGECTGAACVVARETDLWHLGSLRDAGKGAWSSDWIHEDRACPRASGPAASRAVTGGICASCCAGWMGAGSRSGTTGRAAERSSSCVEPEPGMSEKGCPRIPSDGISQRGERPRSPPQSHRSPSALARASASPQGKATP
jgi:hypothetical protein